MESTDLRLTDGRTGLTRKSRPREAEQRTGDLLGRVYYAKVSSPYFFQVRVARTDAVLGYTEVED